MMMDKAITTYIAVLKAEIEHLKSKLPEEDSNINALKVTITALQARVKELQTQST